MGFRMFSLLPGALRPACLFAAILLFLSANAAVANPYQQLIGNWSGSGTLTPLKGKAEKVSCDISYRDEGAVVIQAVRCAGASQKFAATLKLALKQGRINGAWEEQVHAASGGVSGTANGGSIRARLSGQKFTGRMSVDVAGPQHTIEIVQRDQASGAYRPVASIVMHRAVQ